MAARQISGGPLISRRSPINPTAAVEGALEGQQIADIEERGTETAMDGDSADSLTWEDAAPAGVSTKQLQLKKTRSIAKPPGENTTALRGPDRDPKLCLLIEQVRFLPLYSDGSLSRRVLAMSS